MSFRLSPRRRNLYSKWVPELHRGFLLTFVRRNDNFFHFVSTKINPVISTESSKEKSYVHNEYPSYSGNFSPSKAGFEMTLTFVSYRPRKILSFRPSPRRRNLYSNEYPSYTGDFYSHSFVEMTNIFHVVSNRTNPVISTESSKEKSLFKMSTPAIQKISHRLMLDSKWQLDLLYSDPCQQAKKISVNLRKAFQEKSYL